MLSGKHFDEFRNQFIYQITADDLIHQLKSGRPEERPNVTFNELDEVLEFLDSPEQLDQPLDQPYRLLSRIMPFPNLEREQKKAQAELKPISGKGVATIALIFLTMVMMICKKEVHRIANSLTGDKSEDKTSVIGTMAFALVVVMAGGFLKIWDDELQAERQRRASAKAEREWKAKFVTKKEDAIQAKIIAGGTITKAEYINWIIFRIDPKLCNELKTVDQQKAFFEDLIFVINEKALRIINDDKYLRYLKPQYPNPAQISAEKKLTASRLARQVAKHQDGMKAWDELKRSLPKSLKDEAKREEPQLSQASLECQAPIHAAAAKKTNERLAEATQQTASPSWLAVSIQFEREKERAERVAAEARAKEDAERLAAVEKAKEEKAKEEAQRLAKARAMEKTQRKQRMIQLSREAQARQEEERARIKAEREACFYEIFGPKILEIEVCRGVVNSRAAQHKKAQELAVETQAQEEAQRLAEKAKAEEEAQRLAAEAKAKEKTQAEIKAGQENMTACFPPLEPPSPKSALVKLVGKGKVCVAGPDDFELEPYSPNSPTQSPTSALRTHSALKKKVVLYIAEDGHTTEDGSKFGVAPRPGVKA